MLPAISLLILALAVSLDGFGVGVMYGLRKIRIPLVSIAIISFCSGLIIYGSMQIGVYLSRFVHPQWAKGLGALILVGIGIWALFQMFMEKEEQADASDAGKQPVSTPLGGTAVYTVKEIFTLELKRFGLIIQILRSPQVADMDRSGNISANEAMLLGLALSLDAFGAGIGAALIGFTPWLTAAVIACASGMFLTLGLRIGFRYADIRWIRKLSILPGFVLIIMGIMKLF
ncbi:sporulation membrane protein YtaF [Paenibacillus sp. GD4]|uniref:sporulation membrane protein YtaF n=1 Tax=Paenibacillus sp. GD4 TaxID=3068890 RepID=UPI002796AFFF|nr:sporulation membrane protein YtaF [Paenibacillus sp. GD4]MDQ1909976.1 sporulation membrane protein YtaF [Paenibacillus sp. GD4]